MVVTPDHEVLIVGAGLSGLAAAIQLRRNGFHNFAILEKADDLGGTWRDNTYPGVTVDIPTIYYSFSFEPAFDWSTFYAPQSELLAYCRACADKYQVRDHIRFGLQVASARYDTVANLWLVETACGRRFSARFLISATGLFSVPRLPDIPGIESFRGKILHSTAWDHGYAFAGKRVAVIGTGATGVQIIPELGETVARLDVYQRTPSWVLPKPDKPLGSLMKWALRRVPGFRAILRLLAVGLVDIPLYGIIIEHRRFRWLSLRLRRMGVDHVRRQIADPTLRDKLIPTFDFGCRRPTFSNKYYPTFLKENVDLITTPIAKVTTDAIVTEDGGSREVDAIVCATGFHVFEKHTNPTFPIHGANGEDLDDLWRAKGRQAYRGVTVNGYPNLFIIYGPYSVVSLSFIRMIEYSVHHILELLKAARRHGAKIVEVRSEAQARDHKNVSSLAVQNIAVQGDCRGALPEAALIAPRPSLRPMNSLVAWWEQRCFRAGDYRFDGRP